MGLLQNFKQLDEAAPKRLGKMLAQLKEVNKESRALLGSLRESETDRGEKVIAAQALQGIATAARSGGIGPAKEG